MFFGLRPSGLLWVTQLPAIGVEMKKRLSPSQGLALLFAVFVGLLQFGHLPVLAGNNDTVKMLLFAALVLTVFFLEFFFLERFFLPRATPLIVLAQAILALSAAGARERFDALILVAALAVGLLFVILTANLQITERRFQDWVTNSLLAFGVPAALLGLFQYMSYGFLGHPWRLPFLLPAPWGPRVSGIYGQPNLFALLLTLVLIGYCYRLLHGEPLGPGRWMMRFRHLPVLLVGWVFFLTHSQNARISVATILGLLAFVIGKGRYLSGDVTRKREIAKVVIAFLAGYVLAHWGGFFFFPHQPSLYAAVSHTTGGDQRLVFWLSSLLIFVKHPWLGVGLDNFKSYFPQYQVKALTLLHLGYGNIASPRWSHSEYLQVLCEGGIFSFLAVMGLMALLLYGFRREVHRGRCDEDPRFLYVHLLLFPFLLQSLFSWPLRFTPFFLLFTLFLGLVLAGYRGWEVRSTRTARGAVAALAMVGVFVACFLFVREIQVAKLDARLDRQADIPASLPQFESLASCSSSEYYVLRQFLQVFIRYATEKKDKKMGARLVPLAENFVRLDSSYWSCYNLAVLYHLTGMDGKAWKAVHRAIDRKPDFEPAWQLLHYLNMLKASKDTGRPLESFFPKTLPASEWNSIYEHFGNTLPLERQ